MKIYFILIQISVSPWSKYTSAPLIRRTAGVTEASGGSGVNRCTGRNTEWGTDLSLWRCPY